MPFVVKCPEHPTANVDYPADIFEHCRIDHPDESTQGVSDRLERSFVSQAHAHDRAERRIIGCRRCGDRFEVSMMPGDTSAPPTVCEECRA